MTVETLFPGCQKLISVDSAIYVFVHNWESAKQLATEPYLSSIKRILSDLGKIAAFIKYSEHKKPLEIRVNLMNTTQLITQNNPLDGLPFLEIGSVTMSKKLYQELYSFLEFPEKRSGIILLGHKTDLKAGRLQIGEEQQIAMSKASAVMVKGTTLKEAVQRKRKDYVFLPHLETMNLATRQIGTEFEFSFAAVSKDGKDWRRFTNQYYLFEDEFGIVYQKSVNLGIEQLATAPRI